MAIEYIWNKGKYQAVGESEVVRQLKVEVVDSLPETGSPGVIYIVPTGEEPGGEAVWGSITGTLSNQTDLQETLDSKVNNSRLDKYLFDNNSILNINDKGILLGPNYTDKTDSFVINSAGSGRYWFSGLHVSIGSYYVSGYIIAWDDNDRVPFYFDNDDATYEGYAVSLDDPNQQSIFDNWVTNGTILHAEYLQYKPSPGQLYNSGNLYIGGNISAPNALANIGNIRFKNYGPYIGYYSSGYSYQNNLYVASDLKPLGNPNNYSTLEIYTGRKDGFLKITNGNIELPGYSSTFSSGVLIGSTLVGIPKAQGYFGIASMSVNSSNNQYDFNSYILKITSSELTSDNSSYKIGTSSAPFNESHFHNIYVTRLYTDSANNNIALIANALIPNSNNGNYLGSTSKKFNTIYVTNISDGTNTASVASIINSSGGGTTVVANPSLSGNEPDLNGLQVGQQKYKINNNIFSTDIDWSDGDEWDLSDDTYSDISNAIVADKVIKFDEGTITRHYYPAYYFEDSHTEQIDTGEIDEETGEPIYEEIEIYEYHHQYSYTYFDSSSNKQKFEIVTFTTNDQDSSCKISVSQKQL